MNDRELLEFIAAQVGTLTETVGTLTETAGALTETVGTLTETVDGMESSINNLENDMQEVKNQVTIIEQDHGAKLDVLLDGYKQNAEKLVRVEKEVSKHEEVILRRIR